MLKPVINKARCRKCGDIIESKSVHDFVWCSCKSIAVDGGHEYAHRTAVDWNLFEDLSVYEETERPYLIEFMKGHELKTGEHLYITVEGCFIEDTYGHVPQLTWEAYREFMAVRGVDLSQLRVKRWQLTNTDFHVECEATPAFMKMQGLDEWIKAGMDKSRT